MPEKNTTNPGFLPVLIVAFVFLTAHKSKCQTVTLPRLSPQASVTQTIGISSISVRYSRPSVKGRKIWGDIVPYGLIVQAGMGLKNPAPWRAGADENTTISFSHDVKAEGVNIPAGTYGLFFTIHEDNSGEVILSKNSTSWGSFFYNPAEDLLRAKIKIRDHAFTELLTYDFINLTKNTGELVLNWENKQFPVKISFAVNEIVMSNARKELQGIAGMNTDSYIAAAFYSFQNNINTELGKAWIDKALEAEPTNYEAIWVKARFLIRDGKSGEAEEIIKTALEKASESEITGFGNLMMELGITDRAIKIFTVCTVRYPESADAWFYLGEAYYKKGNKTEAAKSYKKALRLNPTENYKLRIENKLKEPGMQ